MQFRDNKKRYSKWRVGKEGVLMINRNLNQMNNNG